MNNRGSILIFLLLITGVISFFLMQSLYYAKLNQKLCYNYYNKFTNEKKFEKLVIVFSELIKHSLLYNNYFDEEIFKNFQKEKKITIDNDIFYIKLQRENELTDINIKNEVKIKEEIKNMFEDELDDIKVSEITDSILDWIDKDDLKRLNGAEKEDYEKLGYLPSNQNLKDIFELKKIKHINDDIFFKPEIEDNEIVYKGLLTIFTIYKNGFSKYNVLAKKNIYYKNILRLYVRPDNKKEIYIIFLGEQGSRYYLLSWKRLM